MTILNIVKYMFRIRFSVAIKGSKLVSSAKILTSRSRYHMDGEYKIDKSDVMMDPDIDLLMDEAKTMFSIDGYHENIVNLQGIGYEADFINGTLLGVSRNMKTSFINKKRSNINMLYDIIKINYFKFFKFLYSFRLSWNIAPKETCYITYKNTLLSLKTL